MEAVNIAKKGIFVTGGQKYTFFGNFWHGKETNRNNFKRETGNARITDDLRDTTECRYVDISVLIEDARTIPVYFQMIGNQQV